MPPVNLSFHALSKSCEAPIYSLPILAVAKKKAPGSISTVAESSDSFSVDPSDPFGFPYYQPFGMSWQEQ